LTSHDLTPHADLAELNFVRPATAPSLGRLEHMPKWLNLVPMVAQWLWLSLRYGSFTLPATANPAIAAGGLAGEGKSEYFAIMGAHARSFTADFVLVKNNSGDAVAEAFVAMRDAGLTFPLIAKPDIGWCGFGVRLIADPADLKFYLDRFPKDETVILQRFIAYEGEAGLYYTRHPGDVHGQVTGVLLRAFPRVVGDGRRTVAQLIAADPRVHRLGQDGRSEPCCDPDYVPRAQEIVRVSITGSTRVGGLYSDATSLVTTALSEAVDAIAKDMTELHVARFDVRYETLGALGKGRNFTIIEVNGAGSEAVHAWDPRYSLAEAYRIVFAKQKMLFRIGAAMRARGNGAPGLFTLAKLYLRQAALIRRYPPSN
jgi:hypothetical protein